MLIHSAMGSSNRTLDVSHNTLSGPVSAVILALTSLTSLTSLTLSYNGLSGPFPSAVGDLTGLAFLSLSNNAGVHSTLPSTLGLLTQMMYVP